MRADELAHHCGQRTRVVHNVAAIQEVGVAELLAGEIGSHSDDFYPGRLRRFDSLRRVLDSQALLRPHTQFGPVASPLS